LRGDNSGIIRADDGRDVFLHKGEVRDVAYNDLEVGAVVDFELIEDRLSGPRAQNVRLARARKVVVP
jgi:cold shock CspA family protein